jgi:hypothetical protein
MVSLINPSKPDGPIAYTADVRDNFGAAKTEIEALQTGLAAATGTVTRVNTGAGLSGGPITTSGTLVAEWHIGDVSALGPHLTLTGGTLEALSDWHAGVVNSLGPGLVLAAGVLSARQSVRLQAQWNSGSTIVNDTFYFAYDAPYAGTINSLTHFCSTGSFTCAVQINGVSVTGLGAVAPTATPATTNATAANTFSAGQRISGTITAASTTPAPTDALLSLNVTWSN